MRKFGLMDKLQNRRYGLIICLVVFGLVGVIWQLSSMAATPVVSFESENGTRSNGAQTVSDATASSSQAVLFKSASSTEQPMLMGVSASNYNHGGFDQWDAWRVYRENTMLEVANQAGVNRPKVIAYSESGPNLGGANPDYNTVYSHVLGKLNSFYYTSANGQTHSSRWGIRLFWSNGNENFDKGALEGTDANTTSTDPKVLAYVTSQKALYDAVHYVDPSTNSRRFPDAYAGSNPTHYAEKMGWVEAWLHPSAKYHDFVMWSMYPPRKDADISDPVFHWPTFNEAQQTTENGFLIRTFYRTKQAEAEAGHPLMISVGEIGIPYDPDDGTTRPYYAVNGLAHSLERLSNQYDLVIPFACWWDSQVDASSPNFSFDEQTPGLNPSTAQAWRNWKQYDHLTGGTKPAAWQGNPKASWKTAGSPPTQ